MWNAETISSQMGATDFSAELETFLKRETPSFPKRTLNKLGSCTFNVYKQFKRVLPSLRGLPDDIFVDRVQARPAMGRTPARFDTVLWVEDQTVAGDIGVEGEYFARINCFLYQPLLDSRQDIVLAKSVQFSRFPPRFSIPVTMQRRKVVYLLT